MNVLSRYKSIQRGIISIRLFLKETKGETQVLIDEHFKEENKIKHCLFGCLKVRAWTQRIWGRNIEPDLDYSERKQSFSPLLLWKLKNRISRIWIGFGNLWASIRPIGLQIQSLSNFLWYIYRHRKILHPAHCFVIAEFVDSAPVYWVTYTLGKDKEIPLVCRGCCGTKCWELWRGFDEPSCSRSWESACCIKGVSFDYVSLLCFWFWFFIWVG